MLTIDLQCNLCLTCNNAYPTLDGAKLIASYSFMVVALPKYIGKFNPFSLNNFVPIK